MTRSLRCTCSVRVSNELGASHPRSTKFSIAVAISTSLSIAFVLALIPIIFAKQYPSWFSTDAQVKHLVYKLTPLLAISVINNVQPVLSGMYLFPLLSRTYNQFYYDLPDKCPQFYFVPVTIRLIKNPDKNGVLMGF